MRALAVASSLLVAATAAAAEPVVDRKWFFQVEVPDGWAPVPAEALGPEVLLAWADERSERLVIVSKVVGPSDESHAELLEAGFEDRARRYRRLSAKKLEVGPGRRKKLPAWDLWFQLERDGKRRTMGARFLFFRGYTLSVLVDFPGKRPSREARRILESFVPPPPVK